MRRRKEYEWPFGIDGYCWREGRIFYLYTNRFGFIFLLTTPQPVLVQALLMTNKTQQSVNHRLLDPKLQKDLLQAARQTMTVALQHDPSFSSLPSPAELPDGFPWNMVPTDERRYRLCVTLGLQSEFLH